MVQQYRTSKEPENAEDHFQACACKAVFASSIEGLPETQLSIRKAGVDLQRATAVLTGHCAGWLASSTLPDEDPLESDAAGSTQPR